MGVCNCSMYCCTLLYVHSSIAIILMGKRELIALLNLSSWCLVMVEWLFLAVPWGCLQFVIVVFPDHTHILFLALRMHVESLVKPCYSTRVLKALTGKLDIKRFSPSILCTVPWLFESFMVSSDLPKKKKKLKVMTVGKHLYDKMVFII